jgi:hypothetical protein
MCRGCGWRVGGGDCRTPVFKEREMSASRKQMRRRNKKLTMSGEKIGRTRQPRKLQIEALAHPNPEKPEKSENRSPSPRSIALFGNILKRAGKCRRQWYVAAGLRLGYGWAIRPFKAFYICIIKMQARHFNGP